MHPSYDSSEGTHARRMAGLGARVTEVAHELKVPLSLIVGSLEQLESNVQIVVRWMTGEGIDPTVARAVETASALLDICRQGAERLERVVEQVGDYVRVPRLDAAPGRVELPRLLRATADLVARTASPTPRMVLALPDLPAVLGDEEALGRVFVNLFRNAADALARTADPTVHVTASARPPRETLPAHVEVWVRDNGPGIAVADRPRVFEPFFSARPDGAGLGLGLAIARDVVEATGGTIALAPDRGPGTQFVIRLPVAP